MHTEFENHWLRAIQIHPLGLEKGLASPEGLYLLPGKKGREDLDVGYVTKTVYTVIQRVKRVRSFLASATIAALPTPFILYLGLETPC